MQQADRALSATNALASPGTDREVSAKLPTRRGALGVLAGLPLLSMASLATVEPLSGNAAWTAAMRDLDEARRILSRTAPAYAAARAALEATAPDEALIDWGGLEGAVSRRSQLRQIDTVKVRADTLRHIEQGYWRHDPERPQRRLAALDQLDAHRAAVAENHRRHDAVYRPALIADEAAVACVDQCEERLMSMPAPHGEALLWKIQHLINDDGDGTTASWSINYAEPMLRDARRLLKA